MAEFEYLRDYDDIKFAITWQDREPTTEEIEKIKQEYNEYGYEEFTVMTLKEYIYEVWEQIENEVPEPWDLFIDIPSFIHSNILEGTINLIKTEHGYAVVIL